MKRQKVEVTMGWEKAGHSEVVFNGYRGHVWGGEKVLEMDSGDS